MFSDLFPFTAGQVCAFDGFLAFVNGMVGGFLFILEINSVSIHYIMKTLDFVSMYSLIACKQQYIP